MPSTLEGQLSMLEAAWSDMLTLAPSDAEASLDAWRPLVQDLIRRGHGQVLLIVLEGVLRQASIRSQRWLLIELSANLFQWPQGSELLQRQWSLLQEWLG